MLHLVDDINALRELGGASYRQVASDLRVSVPATKSLLLRARGNLAQADAARRAVLALAA